VEILQKPTFFFFSIATQKIFRVEEGKKMLIDKKYRAHFPFFRTGLHTTMFSAEEKLQTRSGF
jgi:hypothetical protein